MKQLLVVVGMVGVVGIVVAAIIVGGRLMQEPAEASAASARSGRQMVMAHDDGSGPQQVRVSTTLAPELPDRPSEAGGVFVRREDDAIVVGTGSVEVNVNITSDDEEPQVAMTSDGPEVEVLLTRDTVIYEDITDMDAALSERTSGEVVVQQAVRQVDSAEDIGANTEVEVWGERRGDRIVAEVIVYRKVSF